MLVLLTILFVFFAILPMLNTIWGVANGKPTLTDGKKNINFGIVITAYGEIDFAKKLIESILKQSFQNYTIYLVIDNYEGNLNDFNYPNLVICKPEKNLNSKVKSINYAISKFSADHNYIVICDSDNLLHPDFFFEINKYHQAGFKAVQGVRKAKNLNTKYACLDSIGEIYYNFVDRKSLFYLGSSSTLSGSGMSFELSLYKKIMSCKTEKIIGGFDKVLQGRLVCAGEKIAFAEKAIVFDEKIQTRRQLTKQRTRWLHSYFKYLKYGLFSIILGINNFSINQFWFGLNHFRPPFFILFSGLFTTTIISLISNSILFYVCISAFLIFGINILIVMLLSEASFKQLKSLTLIPLFIFNQFISLTGMKKAGKKFLITKNNLVKDINEITNV